ncbi:MAG: MbtH protein [Phenylobacterium sp.]|jgi:MbtH protein
MDKEAQYHVVRNHQAQYSIWPAFKALPAGWCLVDQSGSKAVCLEYIKRVWTDMRPLSVKRTEKT